MEIKEELMQDMQFVEEKLKTETDQIFKAFWEGQRYALLRLLRQHHDEYDKKYQDFKQKWCEVDNR